MGRWPSSILALKRRFPDKHLVQMRLTFPGGDDISYDGVVNERQAELLMSIVHEVLNTPNDEPTKGKEKMISSPGTPHERARQEGGGTQERR